MIELHSLLRYFVLLLLIIAIGRGFSGWFGKKAFTQGDDKTGLFLMIFSHIQLLIGLYLYFMSDLMKAINGMPMGDVMKNPDARFWKVEHITGMLFAIVLITLGRIMTKKATDPIIKHRRSAVYYTLALILIIYTIPWAMRGWNPF